MTRKDYEAVAGAIRQENEEYMREAASRERAALRSFAMRFALIAQSDNPRFDRVRFMRACGFED